MLDDAAFFAASSLDYDYFLLTANFELKFFKPVAEGLIRSKGNASIDENGRIQGRSVLYDEKGNIVAKGSGGFAKSKTRLYGTKQN